MMTLPVILLAFAQILNVFGKSNDKPAQSNKYVVFSASLSNARIKQGGSGELQLSLKPVKGIHINATPPLQLKLDSLEGLSLNGSPVIPKAKKPDYVDTSTPIRQRFTIASSLSPGTHALKGMLTYYYCSDAEGWCSKYKQPIEVKLTVVQ